MKALPVPPSNSIADDLHEVHGAIKYLVGLYLDRVPAAEVERDELAGSIHEGLRDEFTRLYLIERQQPEAATTHKRNRITREHLQQVADVYHQAGVKGEPPTRAVADGFGVSHSTAAKWVGHARREGLLPATVKGRAS